MISSIPVISVSYNAPKLIEALVTSFRRYYSNKIYIIDGSEQIHYEAIRLFCESVDNVELIHFDYNIHHGPGMAWAFQHLPFTGRVLVLDSDVVVVNPGFIESLAEHLRPDMYGVGYLGIVNEEGFDLDLSTDKGIPYLKPPCMLLNIEVVRQWPMPEKHGAPMTPTMIAIHNAGRSDLLGRVDWLHQDFDGIPPRQYLIHDWQGTSKANNSYELDEWLEAARQRKTLVDMLAAQVPVNARRIVEIGENDGLLARVLKQRDPSIHYLSLQNQAADPLHQKIWSDDNKVINFAHFDEASLDNYVNVDCFILDRALERLLTPWTMLEALRKVCRPDNTIVIKIPNPQHWKRLSALCAGNLAGTGAPKFYVDQPLQLQHLAQLLDKAGFVITQSLMIFLGAVPPADTVDRLFQLSTLEEVHRKEYEKRLHAESFLITATPK
jgi:hypothetical protein